MSSHPRPDRFEFRRVLGKGGVGEVLLTWDRERGEEVALKSVRLAEVGADVVEAEKNGTRLQRELARIAPHVPRVFEEGEDEEFYFLVMEYVAGKDLSKVLDNGPLPENRAIPIAIQLFDFLARLHSFTGEIGRQKILGIIHGDIKPENIRLQDGDRVRVIDFGIAKQLSLSRSFTKNLFGSLPYLPPERLEHGTVDIHSDLWAAAVVLYSMVSGRLPYAGTTEDTIVRKIRAHDISSLPATCSRPLEWIIRKSLTSEVDRRFPTAAAFREQLEILRDGGSLDDVSQHSTPRSATTQPSQPTQPPPDPPKPKPATARPAETRRTSPPPPQKAVQPPVLPQAPRSAKRPAVSVRPSPSPAPARPATGARKSPWPPWLLLPLLGILAVGYLLWPDRQRQIPEDPDPPISEPGPEVSPQDRARVLYSQGQAALAEAEELSGQDAEEKRTEAKAAFEEAARLDEEWPEPLLGSARVLVNGGPPDENELEKFEALRKEARRRGHRDSRAFDVLLADSYLAAGRRLWAQAGPDGGPYECELLWEAHDNLEAAVGWYEKAGDLGSAASSRTLKNRVAGPLADLCGLRRLS